MHGIILIRLDQTKKSGMVKRIGIFRALYLGDMLCIIPVTRALRKAWPASEIYLIGLPWQEDFVNRFSQHFDRFIEFPGWPGLPEQSPDGGRILEFLHQVRSHEFDLVLQMQGNGDITNSMCMLWNATKVCGLRKEGGYAPDPSLFPVSEDNEHETLRFMKLLDCLGIPRQGIHLEFPIAPAESIAANLILKKETLEDGRYVCIHPGARDPRRRWPVQNFAYIAQQLISTGKKVVLTGSKEEEHLLRDLQHKIDKPVVNIVERHGHLSAGELAALLKNALLMVSNDTGVSHIASALGVRSVILFSPHSAFSRWRPLNANRHVAVSFEKGRDPEAVAKIVLAEIEKAEAVDQPSALYLP